MPELETNSTAIAGSSPVPCSPSFATPQTDKVWHETLDFCNKRDEYPDPHHVALANLAEKLERELAAAHKALMVCDGAMMGKVKPSSVAFKMINAIIRPENV
jgi:hypothetical protein